MYGKCEIAHEHPGADPGAGACPPKAGPRTIDHVSAAQHELHWLPIRKRIDYKLCLLVHNVRIGHAPEYMSELLTATYDVPSKASLRSSNSGDFVVPAT